MNAPVIWILIPGLAAVLLYGFNRWHRIVHISAVFISLLLAATAWQLEIGEPISLGWWPASPTITITPSVHFLGRDFVLNNGARPALMLIYLGVAFWLAGGLAAGIRGLFVPIGLALAGMKAALFNDVWMMTLSGNLFVCLVITAAFAAILLAAGHLLGIKEIADLGGRLRRRLFS